MAISSKTFHYILLLDGSGSMRGQKWKDLMEAVQVFLERRRALETEDHVTIIVFSDKANTAYSDELIPSIDVNRIPYIGGGTSFNRAFACVNGCIAIAKGKIDLNPIYENNAIINSCCVKMLVYFLC